MDFYPMKKISLQLLKTAVQGRLNDCYITQHMLEYF